MPSHIKYAAQLDYATTIYRNCFVVIQTPKNRKTRREFSRRVWLEKCLFVSVVGNRQVGYHSVAFHARGAL